MNKYRAIKTEVDGITFDSKKEANRYCELKLLLREGKINVLILQPEFKLEVNGYLICKYRADFQYKDKETGQTIIEDTKGYKTQIYRLKKKLMKAVFDIDILET